MESLKLKINKKLLIFLFSVLALSLLVILFINLTPEKKTTNPLLKLSKQLQNCNTNFDNLINDSGIDIDKTTDALSNNSLKLDSLKNSLDDINVEDDDIKSKLYENINCNTTLNSLCLSLLKKPQAEDFSSKYNDFLNSYNMLLDNYSSLQSSGINIEFPDSAKKFFDYASKYYSTLISLNRDKDIKVLQRNNYISSIKNCIESFDKIDEDLKPALDKIREENRDFDNLLKDVRDKKSSLNEIKNTSYCISIPENGNECFNLLQDTINYYELYITSLEHSIVIEKTSDCEDNKKNIDENYENSFSKFSDFEKSLKNLRTELDKFNNK